MRFLPIVERELRVAARRRGTYWVRAMAALGAILIGCFVFVASHQEPSHVFGTSLFMALSNLAMIYCVTAGIRVTADCLSEEKREGTLGLLFLTDLKGYDVVLGKLVASSLNALYGLIAIFPILAVPLLLGGIKAGELGRVVLVLLNTFGFSLAAGMLVSALSRFPRKAMAGTFLLLLTISAGLPVCAAWLLGRNGGGHYQWAGDLYLGSPFYSFQQAGENEYRTGFARFWWSTGLVHGATWLCLAMACFIVPRSWQDKPAGARGQHWREIWQRWSYGDEAERKAFRKSLLDVNAYCWLAGRARLKPLHVWSFLGIVACFWAWGCLEFGGEWFNVATYFITAVVMNGILKYWIASESGRRFGEDRQAGALELLLSTPMSVPEILHGQLLALKRQFLWPLLTVLGVEILFLLATLQNESYEAGQSAMWLAGIIMLVVDVITLPWVAMWVALSSKTPNRATGITVVRVLLLPWVLFVGVIILVGVASYSNSFDPSWKFFVGLWMGLGLLTDITLGTSAWRQLHANFRLLAMERFVPKPSRLARMAAARKSAGRA